MMKNKIDERRINIISRSEEYLYKLINLITLNDLNFHEKGSLYASHNFHSFPAKFPPQLPSIFISNLTSFRDIVLDPMQGSGTTLLEANLLGRIGIGFDIDPLAIKISKVKNSQLDPIQVAIHGKNIVRNAKIAIQDHPNSLWDYFHNYWQPETIEFINYWFDIETQLELLALICEIQKIQNTDLKRFFELALSAIIITKSGGVSLALDLGHTRPHRAKLVYSKSGKCIEGIEFVNLPANKTRHLTKYLRSPIDEFEKRVLNNLKGILEKKGIANEAHILMSDAQQMPLSNNSIDLIVTSPPYASNAIDYMRAHKFALVWFGYSIDDLSNKRSEYIGSELINKYEFEDLPIYSNQIVTKLKNKDVKRGLVLHRYYSEMTRVMREMYRVLKPGKAAIVVVGNSQIKGIDTETQNCLADIGRSIGFEVPAIGVRNLDRNRRMMPAGGKLDLTSQIQKRMHKEYVIGFYKSENATSMK
jgi:DNA modification methylase